MVHMVIRIAVVAVAIGVQLLAVRFLTYSTRPLIDENLPPEPVACDLQGGDDAVQRFSRLLQFPSVSNGSATGLHIGDEQRPVFDAMLEFLVSTYSEVYNALEVEMVGAGNYTTLLTWRGSDASLLPLLFVSHYDVVPVTHGTEGDWTYGPFSGAVADGFVWGRGSLDIKVTVSALLEVLTQLVRDGFAPKRTIYLAFGHDEEVGGNLGAAAVAELLQARGVTLEVVVDEGGAVLADGVPPIIASPVALIGTSEKVFTMVEVSLTSSGGHSSMPPVDGSDIASQMARLLSYVGAHQFPKSLRPPVSDFLQSLAPVTDSPLLRYALQHCTSWPFNWIMAQAFSRSPESAALVRTTLAVTRVAAGVADNVLPQQGTLLFNLRSHPQDASHEDILGYFNNAIRRAGVSGVAAVHLASHWGPIPNVTNCRGPHFRALKRAIQETWQYDGKPVAVAPFLMSGGTDSKHYADLPKHGILRFNPYSMNKTAGDVKRVHSTNERVAVSDFKKALCTFRRAIELLSEDLSAEQDR